MLTSSPSKTLNWVVAVLAIETEKSATCKWQWLGHLPELSYEQEVL